MRTRKDMARNNQQELDLAVVPPSDNEEDSKEIERQAKQKQAEYNKRIADIFKWPPGQKTRYPYEVI